MVVSWDIIPPDFFYDPEVHAEVGVGSNEPLSPEKVHSVLGNDAVTSICNDRTVTITS